MDYSESWRLKRKDRIAWFVISVFGLIVCCLFCENKVSDWISLLILFGLMVEISIENIGFVVKYIFVFFVILSAVVSETILEYTNAYMNELQSVSYHTGSLPLYVTSYWLLLATIVCVDIACDKKKWTHVANNDKYSDRVINFITMIVLAVAMLCWIHIIKRPAFLLGLDRFAYKSLFGQNKLERVFDSMYTYLIVFPCISLKRGYKKLGIISIVVIMCYSLWTGNKFTSFMSILSVICWVFFREIYGLAIKHRRTILISTMFIMLAMIMLAGFLQSKKLSGRQMDIKDYFYMRVAGQSELWWKTYSMSEGKAHIEEFKEDVKAVFNGKDTVKENVGAKNGGYRIMYYCASADRVNAYLSKGIRWGECGYASVYYLFGPAGCVAWSIICGFMYSLITNAIIGNVDCGRFIRVFFLVRIMALVKVSASYFIFSNFVDAWSIISYIILIITAGSIIDLKYRGKSVIQI